MQLDDYIKNNADKFNDEEPPEGHRQRFEQRLKGISVKKRNKIPILKNAYFYPAAAIIIGITSGLLFLARSGNAAHICLLSEEMLETQNYYASELDTNVERLKKILADVDADARAEVMTEVEIIMEDSEKLPPVLCNNNDESFNVLVNFYNSKINTVQNIILIMESRTGTTNI